MALGCCWWLPPSPARVRVQGRSEGPGGASAVEAEEEAGAAQGTFDAISLPTSMPTSSGDSWTSCSTRRPTPWPELRIAVRRGRLAELGELAAPLAKVAEGLHAFAEAHA
jgi:hypothetical protein